MNKVWTKPKSAAIHHKTYKTPRNKPVFPYHHHQTPSNTINQQPANQFKQPKIHSNHKSTKSQTTNNKAACKSCHTFTGRLVKNHICIYYIYRLLNTDHTTAYTLLLKYDILSIPLHTPHAYRPLITPCLLAQYNIYNSQYGKYISQNFVSNSSLTNISAIHTYMYITPRYKYFQIHLPYLNRITHALPTQHNNSTQ